MQMRLMRVCLSISFSLSLSQALAQLFYDDCTGGKCRKAFIQETQKAGDELYLVRMIFLTYHRAGTTDADEQNRSARVSCSKNKPTVTWGDGKAQIVDKRIFASPGRKKDKVVEPEKPVKYDETNGLWKKICGIP